MATATTGTAKVTLPTDTEILMTREFNAPRHLVYRAYTTPELVRRWWAGRRGTVTSAEIDLRVGGAWRYVMTTAEGGHEVAFHGEFKDIVPDERLVNTEVFEGAPPEAGSSLVTVTFEDAGPGRTTMRMRSAYDSLEVRDVVLATGMEDGAQESLDGLEATAIELAG
jgi:uncharacterized protein YndB with AHSA1/START domain